MVDIYIELYYKHSLLKEDQEMTLPLSHFFAVTESGSLYRVYSDDGAGHPGMEKLALFGESTVPAGGKMEGDLSDRIGIMHNVGIVIYFPLSGPHNPPRPDLVTVCWSDVAHTSKIVALFLEEADAKEFLESHFSKSNFLVRLWQNLKDPELSLKKLAKKFKSVLCTLATLTTIGDDHPRFVLDSAFARLLK
jgi:hypothetical protein